jgi:primosomal protein N' (replication factor Y)
MPPTFVEVAVNVPGVSGVFHYHLPEALLTGWQPGLLVEVPFGAQQVQGVIVRQVEQPEVAETKPVTAFLDQQIALTPQQIELAAALADQTLAPLAACLSLMLPSGISQMADSLYSLRQPPEPGTPRGQNERLILEALTERGPLRGRQLNRVLPRRDWQASARRMIEKGWLQREPVLPPPRVRPRYIRTAQLGVPPEIIAPGVEGLSHIPEVQVRRQRILDFLSREPGPVDLPWVYAESGGNLDDLKRLNDMDLILLREQEQWRDPLAGLAYDPAAPPPLTGDQQAAWEQIEAALSESRAGRTPRPLLLHGVTGSGKTELYLKAVAETLKAGRQAIVLVPEIALTPQTVRRFMGRFPGRVGLMHSQLSDGEQYDTWRRARSGKLQVIVGPRSALFGPLPDIGLVVLDESHDDSYYQDTNLPYYHAREAALALAGISKAACLFGSATPDLTSLHQAQSGRWHKISLPARILAHTETVKAFDQTYHTAARYQPAGQLAAMTDLPPVRLVDMREELKAGNRSIFSQALQAGLARVLDAKQQAILFLNRRGSATYVFCRDCGHTLACPRCSTNLTYYLGGMHRAGLEPPTDGNTDGKLICNQCGYTRRMPERCPECGGPHIRHYGMGTQRVEEEVFKLFPQARTLRWDHETTREKGAHDLILSHFTSQRADILIGTQMLAKGLDLPLVTLVGVVLADVGLTLPDYRASERVFQVLAQVSGRAGRSPLGGEVVLQSFMPEHYAIQAAARHDYAGFASQELAYRQELGYPPYARLVRLEYRHLKPEQAEHEAREMGRHLLRRIQERGARGTEMIGPVPCFYARLGGYYRWQVIMRGPDPASLLRGDETLKDWRVEVGPQSLL